MFKSGVGDICEDMGDIRKFDNLIWHWKGALLFE